MAERPEDLNLPLAVVSRLVKEALPSGVNMSKEARTALARSASVFVLFLTSSANFVASKEKRSTIRGQDVINALEETDFTEFEEPLTKALESFKKGQKVKKDASEKRKQQRKSEAKEEESSQAEQVEQADQIEQQPEATPEVEVETIEIADDSNSE